MSTRSDLTHAYATNNKPTGCRLVAAVEDNATWRLVRFGGTVVVDVVVVTDVAEAVVGATAVA